MSTTYAQKQAPAQKKDAPTAASILDTSLQSESLQRKADMANNAAQREEAPHPNNTGMPDNLKAGIESLSGFSMDDVRVHYNSSKPATVQALAYTQGTDIHVAPGQEKHLPHEAWHVAQQMAGRVSPTTNINGMPVNDNAALEHEADVMGEKAMTQGLSFQLKKDKATTSSHKTIQCFFDTKISPQKLNVIGESHDESDARRKNEEHLANNTYRLPYFVEHKFKVNGKFGDNPRLRFLNELAYISLALNRLKIAFDYGTKAKYFSKERGEYFDIYKESINFCVKRIKNLIAYIKIDDLLKAEILTNFRSHEKETAVSNTRTALNNIDFSLLQLEPIFTFPSEFKKNYSNVLEDICFLYDSLKESYSDPDDVSKERSKSIAKFAQENNTKPAIWKIGNDHCKDINELIEKGEIEKRDYVLIDRIIFNQIHFTPKND